MAVPNSFSNQTGPIPLAELDSNFNTPIIIGTTPLSLGSTVGVLDGVSLTNANLGTPLSGTASNITGLPLSSGVTGVLPTSNGGTGVAGTLTGVAYMNGVGVHTIATTAQALALVGTVPIANGGTNSTDTPTAGGVVYGTGTAHAITTAGTSGQVLTSAGAGAPTWTTPTTGTVTSVSGTGTVNGITLTGTVTSSGGLTLGGTLGSIANSQLTNSSITFGATAQALGSTVSALNAVSVGATTASTGAFTTLSASDQTTLTKATGYNLYASGAAPNYLAGGLGIGTTSINGFSGVVSLGGSGAPTGGYLEGYTNILAIPSTVTTRYDGYSSNPTTVAAAFNLTTLRHFSANQGALGSGSTLANEQGFFVDASIIGAANNYGFFGNIPSGTGRWNFYASGTAANYLAGNLLIGTTTVPTTSANLVVAGLQATSSAAPTIASATTIAPTKAITFISGVAPIVTITAPNPISAGGGQITLIPTGIFTTTIADNIALASTAVVGKALIMTYDVTTTKWYPSY